MRVNVTWCHVTGFAMLHAWRIAGTRDGPARGVRACQIRERIFSTVARPLHGNHGHAASHPTRVAESPSWGSGSPQGGRDSWGLRGLTLNPHYQPANRHRPKFRRFRRVDCARAVRPGTQGRAGPFQARLGPRRAGGATKFITPKEARWKDGWWLGSGCSGEAKGAMRRIGVAVRSREEGRCGSGGMWCGAPTARHTHGRGQGAGGSLSGGAQHGTRARLVHLHRLSSSHPAPPQRAPHSIASEKRRSSHRNTLHRKMRL
jgi:hypothetical protein